MSPAVRTALFAAGILLAGLSLTLLAFQLAEALARPPESPAQSPTTQPTTTAFPSEAGVIDPTGILIVAIGEQVQAGPAAEGLAVAFDQALRLAMDHPHDFGYPWLDPATNEVVFSVATSEGRSLAENAGATVTVPFRIREVVHSYAELQRIQDEVTYLRSEGVVDAELIYKVLPDERDNRTLIVMRELSRVLLGELAARFPPEAIAVQVDPNQPPLGY